MKGSRRRNFIHCVSAICIIIFLAMTISIGEHAAWDCPECGRTGNTGNYCGRCGHLSPWIEGGVSENSEDTETMAREAKLKSYKTIGNYVTFGTYPQSEEGTDQTPIEWLVLDYDEVNNKALLLSKYGLDAKPYEEKKINVTWETCSLRKWLNSDFISMAFTSEEQEAILMTQVDNSSAQGYSNWNRSGSNNTEDRIFILSYVEAYKYLGVVMGRSDNIKSRISPTTYTINQGAFTNHIVRTEEDNPTGWWWLRSDSYQDHATNVSHDGSLTEHSVNDWRGVVRPALWINLEMDIF